jgi:hypothetical protein
MTRRWRLWLTLGLLLLLGGLALVRSLMAPGLVDEAARLLRAQHPDFDPARYEVEELRQTPQGDWQVNFVRTDGQGQERYTVFVKERQDWWSRVREWMGVRAAGGAAIPPPSSATPLGSTKSQTDDKGE